MKFRTNLGGDCAPDPNVPQSLGPPTIGNEHCDEQDPSGFSSYGKTGHGSELGVYYDWTYSEEDQKYTRNAQTKLRLKTGGKSVAGQQNLFVISGWAKDVEAADGKRSGPPYLMTWMGNSTPLGNEPYLTDVQIGNLGTLDTNGNIYVTKLDDGADVTPRVAGKNFYCFGVNSPHKYTLTIQANGIDITTNTPTFCVGQQVTFSAVWLDDGDPGALNTICHWDLPDKYVNNSLPIMFDDSGNLMPSGATDYFLDADRLSDYPSTSCWYVNKHGGTCSVGLNLALNGGHDISIAAKGSFNVFRPQVNFAEDYMGTPNCTGSGYMDLQDIGFHADITTTTNFPGNANWTQLIEREVDGLYPAYALKCNTYGAYWLDNSTSYNDGDATINPTNGVEFDDDPDIQCYPPPPVKITDAFKTYLIFKPGGGIGVTLGIVTWRWSETADETNSVWIRTDYSTTSPQYTDSDEFPIWYRTYLNTGQ